MNEELLKRARIITPEDVEIDFMTACLREKAAKCILDAEMRGIPVTLWDPVEKRTYLRYPDGRKEYL